MPKRWVREREQDYYYKKAKAEKYRSRASYKLLQVIKKHGFLKKGDIVVDLGCFPGGWLQVASEIVSDEGFVLGVDLKRVQPLRSKNVHVIIGDIKDEGTQERIKKLLPSLVDVVISDVSPNISGVWEVDHARQLDLARASLKLASELLKNNGNFFVKVFQGDMFQEFVKEANQNFTWVKILKPKASRLKSAEFFLLGLNLKKDKI